MASAEFHPRNSKIILATLTCNEVVLIDLRPGGRRVKLEDVSEDGMDVEGENEEPVERKKKSVRSNL